MKKVAALFFIILFLFNFFGYRLVVEYLQIKASNQLTAKLDNNLYNDSQLLELKLPIHLPYQNNWSSYERFDGEIDINGVPYQYVKRRVINDTLYVMCIVNNKKMYLEKTSNNYFALSNGDNVKNSGNSKISFSNPQDAYDEYWFPGKHIFNRK